MSMIPELTKSALETHAQKHIQEGLHPRDELDLLNARIAKSSPEDEKLPGMLDRRRKLAKVVRLQRLAGEIRRLDDEDEDGPVGPPPGMRSE